MFRDRGNGSCTTACRYHNVATPGGSFRWFIPCPGRTNDSYLAHAGTVLVVCKKCHERLRSPSACLCSVLRPQPDSLFRACYPLPVWALFCPPYTWRYCHVHCWSGSWGIQQFTVMWTWDTFPRWLGERCTGCPSSQGLPHVWSRSCCFGCDLTGRLGRPREATLMAYAAVDTAYSATQAPPLCRVR